MQRVVHPGKKHDAFYVTAFPIRRSFVIDDVLDKQGNRLAMGNRVECITCSDKLDLREVSDYYEMEPNP